MDICIKNQIIAFCFLFYIIHILQPLDVRIFGSLSQIYKMLIKKNTNMELVGQSIKQVFFNIIIMS